MRAQQAGILWGREGGLQNGIELGPEGVSESHKQGEALTKGQRQGGWVMHTGTCAWRSEG